VFVSDCFADLSRVNVRGGSGGFTTADEQLELHLKTRRDVTLQTPPKPVPAPSPLMLVAGGLAGLAGIAWRLHRGK
jgi:hypothetical protein